MLFKMAGRTQYWRDLAQKLKRMRILHTIESLNPKQGGPSSCTYDLLEGLCDIGVQAELLTVKCMNPDEHNLGEGKSWLREVPYDYKTPLCFSRNLKRELVDSEYDLYHVNTLWLYQCHATCQIAREKHRPYVLSPHGMLYPNALRISWWKKLLMLKLWFNKDIREATCLHVTCRQEMGHCRACNYKGPIAVIPNPVVLPDGVQLAESRPEGKRQIGFLGRLHPIKKVENLLYALALLADDDRDKISLQIMGKYNAKYENFLKHETERLRLTECVEFVGFVSGCEKYTRLSKLWALFVPSESENFGMIVPEALICGTPVYASLGTPWEELNEHRCGWWKDNQPETIASVMHDILTISEQESLEMGHRGYQLIVEKYEQHKVARMMKQLYEWILFDGEKPSFVYE